jgi:hypothetical protein
MNPQSVANALSVNPMSVNPPNSVKSVDESQSQSQPSAGATSGATDMDPQEIYMHAMDGFMNVCDQIERSLAAITEAYRQCQKFDSLQQTRAPTDYQTMPYGKMIQPFVESSLDDKRVLEKSISEMTALMSSVRAKTKGQEGKTVEMIKMEISTAAEMSPNTMDTS